RTPAGRGLPPGDRVGVPAPIARERQLDLALGTVVVRALAAEAVHGFGAGAAASRARRREEPLRFDRQRRAMPVPVAVLGFHLGGPVVPRLDGLALAHVVDRRCWEQRYSYFKVRRVAPALG